MIPRPYLCGPISGCTDEEATGWRNHLLEMFPGAIDPMRRDYRHVQHECYREIVDLDKRDIRNCDVVVVRYDATKQFVGSSMEILYAWTLGKPVILWCHFHDVEGLSPWLIYHSTIIVMSYPALSKTISRFCEDSE